ncbi:MAG TPA: hypothetical protein VKJ45_07975 [Blastocatellia bacterium]|nr:hypothetical protein [Blastocatellia bacterium]
MPLSDAELRIDAYLNRLRRLLREVNSEVLRDTVKELRSHIIETTTARADMTVTAIDETIEDLGSPEELAAQYISAGLGSPTRGAGTPRRVVQRLVRRAGLIAVASSVLLGSLLGYSFGLALVLCAALKPFHPQTAGLWLLPDPAGDTVVSIQLGLGRQPAAGHELLGWWIVPAGLLLGCGVVMLATYLARLGARLYCGRRDCRSQNLLCKDWLSQECFETAAFPEDVHEWFPE